MIRNKDVYCDNSRICEQYYDDCVICGAIFRIGCNWLENQYIYEQNDKLPKMKYEYDQK